MRWKEAALSSLQITCCTHCYTNGRLFVYAGARPTWLLGNLGEVSALGGPATAHAVYGRRYGPVWASYGGPVPLVMTDHPVYARRVLQVSPRQQAGPHRRAWLRLCITSSATMQMLVTAEGLFDVACCACYSKASCYLLEEQHPNPIS